MLCLPFLCTLPCIASASWDIYPIHPWVEVTADQLPAACVTPADRLHLSGLGNDWLTAAVVLKSNDGASHRVAVSTHAHEALRRQTHLRVVGVIKQGKDEWLLDPLLERAAGNPYGLSGYLRNFDAIRDFPNVTVTPQEPVMLWLTVKTHGLTPGKHELLLHFVGDGGTQRAVYADVTVGDYALPEDNPLIGYGWQWTTGEPEKRAWLRWFKDYGINCTHIDFDAARQEGYRFFLYTFNPSWGGEAVTDVPEAEVAEALQRIRDSVTKLALKPEEWAIELVDEPNDSCAAKFVEWAKRLRELWPEARFWWNPCWGPGPTNTWATTPGTFEPLAVVADVWCPYSHHLWDPQDPLSVMRRTGKPIWFYEILGMSYSRQPHAGRSMLRLGPWLCWKHRLQGFGFYALDEYSDTDPWGDQTAKYTYAIVYPPIIAGRGLEALRQGFQEYKRLAALRELGCPEGRLDEWVTRAMGAHTAEEFDVIRAEMDDEIMRRSDQ